MYSSLGFTKYFTSVFPFNPHIGLKMLVALMGTSRNQFQRMLNTQNYKVQWAWLPRVRRKKLSLYFVILFRIFKGICTLAFLNFLLWAWPLVLVLKKDQPVVAVFCVTQNKERSLPCKVHMIKISLDVSDNAFFFLLWT